MSAPEVAASHPRLSISPYVARPIRFLELWQPPGWQIKLYGIAYGRPVPPTEFVEAVKQLALRVLPTEHGYGIAFAGAHVARSGCYAFVDWWGNENELFHRGFLGPSHDTLAPAGGDDSMACVWDLAVIDFERRAWHELVVRRPEAPVVDGYLARRLEATL